MNPERHHLEANGVRLSALTLGPEHAPPLVMLHGMRDVSASLLPVAGPLARNHRVVLPELRGHGASDQPGSYHIDDFLFDLHCVLEHFGLVDPVLFGHSLGGQIVARFAAAFPRRARAAVLAEGLGPPARPGEGDEAAEVGNHGNQLLNLLTVGPQQRPLPGLEFAAERLLANNPRLPAPQAAVLAVEATRRNADGELVWAFDPRVRSVFLGVRRADTERYWRHVRCPTLIVSGALAHEYWRGHLGLEWDGRFAGGELESRVACFPDAEHRVLDDAGHMVHYDRPSALSAAIADFLERRR